MHLPQSQNKNINNMCIVGNPVHIISEQGDVKRCKKPYPEPIMDHVGSLFPYHVTAAYVRTGPLYVFA